MARYAGRKDKEALLDKAALVAEKEICGTFWADETSVNLSDTSGFRHKKNTNL